MGNETSKSRAPTCGPLSLPDQNLEDMDSDDWGSDSDSDSESDDSDDGGDMLKGRAKWVKKTDDTDDKKKRKDEKRAAKAEEGKKGRKEKASSRSLSVVSSYRSRTVVVMAYCLFLLVLMAGRLGDT